MITRLKILGKTYEVQADPELLVREEEGARILIFKQQIHYDPNQHKEQIRELLLHEVVHAIDEELGQGLEEHQVQSISAALFAVLRENPEFARWLMDNTL